MAAEDTTKAKPKVKPGQLGQLMAGDVVPFRGGVPLPVAPPISGPETSTFTTMYPGWDVLLPHMQGFGTKTSDWGMYDQPRPANIAPWEGH